MKWIIEVDALSCMISLKMMRIMFLLGREGLR